MATQKPASFTGWGALKAARTLGMAAGMCLSVAIAGEASAQDRSATPPGAQPKMFFEGDMVLAQACVLNNRFRRNEGVVWRVRVLNAKTGQPIEANGLKSLVIELPDGKTIPMKHGGHPRGGTDDRFWSSSWKVPENYPTGTFAYTVVATDLSGEVVRWQPFSIKASQLTIVDE